MISKVLVTIACILASGVLSAQEGRTLRNLYALEDQRPDHTLLSVSSNLALHWSEGSYNGLVNRSEVVLSCMLSGIPLPHTRLEWREDEMPLSNSSHRIVTQNPCKATLHIRNFTFLDYGRYKCKLVAEEVNFNHGIPFYFEDLLNAENEEAVTVNLYSSYVPSGELSRNTQIYTLPKRKVNIQCGPSRRINNTLWTEVSQDGIPRTLPISNSRIPLRRKSIPNQNIKFLCHSSLSNMVYSIHYFHPSFEYENKRPKIVYPTSELVDYHYTVDSLKKSEGEIDLCLIQPYANQQRETSFNYTQGNKTFTADPLLSPMLTSWEQMSVSIGSKLISGGSKTSLLHYLKIENLPTDEARLNKTLRLLAERVITGTFSCSSGGRNRLSFTVTLTKQTEEDDNEDFVSYCLDNMSGSEAVTNVTGNSTWPTGVFSVTVSANRLSLIIASGVMALAVVVIAVSLFICVCCVRINNKRKVNKMSPVQIKLLRSFANPVFELVPTMSKEDKLIQELEASDLFFTRESLTLLEDIGSGAFGVVKKAQLSPGSSSLSTTVAVKMLKDSFTPDDENDLVMEIRTLLHVGHHSNLVNLLGASLIEGKLCVLMEYCERGNLLQYLREKRTDLTDPLTIPTMINMASQIANGMTFLAYKNCIHRDLAARNVLISTNYTLKIADFGLARKMYNSVYRPTAKRLPIKWLAPEGIIDGVFTTKSDVWSFGVLLWEIFTLGRTPYPGVPAHRVVNLVESGYRMPPPKSCPQEIYELMMRCWLMEPSGRPGFVDLMTRLVSMGTKYSHKGYYNLCCCEDHYDNGTVEFSNPCAHCHPAEVDYINMFPREWFQSTDQLDRGYVAEILQEHTQRECCDQELSDCEECSCCGSEFSDYDPRLSYSDLLSSQLSMCTLCKQVNDSL